MKMNNPPSPGEILKDMYMKPRNLGVTECAKQLQISSEDCKMLLNGKLRLDRYIINRLSIRFDTSQTFWWNLEKSYRDWLEEKEDKEDYAKGIKALEKHELTINLEELEKQLNLDEVDRRG